MADSNPKSQYGLLKPQFDKVPPTALVHLAAVMALGGAKYGPFNWRDDPVSASVYVAAAQRHLLAWFDGEDIDPESGASHLAHVMACCAILIDAGAFETLIDDRPARGRTVTADVIRELTKVPETVETGSSQQTGRTSVPDPGLYFDFTTTVEEQIQRHNRAYNELLTKARGVSTDSGIVVGNIE